MDEGVVIALVILSQLTLWFWLGAAIFSKLYPRRPAALWWPFFPVIGLASLLLVVNFIGNFVGFSFFATLTATITLGVCALFSLGRNAIPVSRYLALIYAISVPISAAVIASIYQHGGVAILNDSLTYLLHSEVLQSKIFRFGPEAYPDNPAYDSIISYERLANVGRMGATFFLAYIQSLYAENSSLNVYPAAFLLPLIAGSAALGGITAYAGRGILFVNCARLMLPWSGSEKTSSPVRRHIHDVKKTARTGTIAIACLSAILYGASTNGFRYGSYSGFFPQTFGLALLAGGFLAALPTMGIKLSVWKPDYQRPVLLSLILSALLITYPEILPLVFCFIAICLIIQALHVEKNYRAPFLKTITVETLFCATAIAVLCNKSLMHTWVGTWRAFDSFVVHSKPIGTDVTISAHSVSSFLLDLLGFSTLLAGTGDHRLLFGSMACTIVILTLVCYSLLLIIRDRHTLRKKERLSLFFFLISAASLVTAILFFLILSKHYLVWKVVVWGSIFMLSGSLCVLLIARRPAPTASSVGLALLLLLLPIGYRNDWRTLNEPASYLSMTLLQGNINTTLKALKNGVNTIDNKFGGRLPIFACLGGKSGYFGSLYHLIGYLFSDRPMRGDWTGASSLPPISERPGDSAIPDKIIAIVRDRGETTCDTAAPGFWLTPKNGEIRVGPLLLFIADQPLVPASQDPR